jgi:hypothetical protein
MLATPENEMLGTMSRAILTDVIQVAMEQWSAQHCVILMKRFYFFYFIFKTYQIFQSTSI